MSEEPGAPLARLRELALSQAEDQVANLRPGGRPRLHRRTRRVARSAKAKGAVTIGTDEGRPGCGRVLDRRGGGRTTRPGRAEGAAGAAGRPHLGGPADLPGAGRGRV